MNKQYDKRLNVLEERLVPEEEEKLLLFTSLGYEKVVEFQAHLEEHRVTPDEALQEAFVMSGKPGKIEDYQIINICGVSVKPSEDAVTVYSAHEMNSRRDI